VKIPGVAAAAGIETARDGRPSYSTDTVMLVNPSSVYGTTALTWPVLVIIIGPGVPSNRTLVPASRFVTNPRPSNCNVTGVAGPRLVPKIVIISPGEIPPSTVAPRKLAAFVTPAAVIAGGGPAGGSVRFTVAVADRDVSATLVARTVTAAALRKLAGAV
jgi:hypothetical protein